MTAPVQPPKGGLAAQLRDYLRGVRSQAEVAAELGIGVRQLQRIEEEAIARWLLGIARAMREAIGDENSSTETPESFGDRCRISENRPEHREHAQRVDRQRLSPGAEVDRRAGRLPRRFKP